MNLHVSPKKALGVLLSVIFALLLMHVALQSLRLFTPYGQLLGYIDRFDVNMEQSVPTWFSTLQLFLAGVVLTVIALRERAAKAKFAWAWAGLAAVFFLLSADESATLHEMLSNSSFGFWIKPMLGILAVFLLVYLRFFWSLPALTKKLFAFSFVLFVGGAMGMEHMYTFFYERGGEVYGKFSLLVEEGLEMVAIAVFIYAALEYLQNGAKELQVNLASQPGVQQVAGRFMVAAAALVLVWGGALYVKGEETGASQPATVEQVVGSQIEVAGTTQCLPEKEVMADHVPSCQYGLYVSGEGYYLLQDIDMAVLSPDSSTGKPVHVRGTLASLGEDEPYNLKGVIAVTEVAQP